MGTYFQTALGKVIGSKNERELKRLSARVEEINALEPEMQKLEPTPNFRGAPKPLRSAWRRAKRSTICWPKPLRCAARPAGAR